MTREEMLNKIRGEEEWDIVVIGGGATGLGIALEAASRKYKTLVVDQSDFAKSTSSKSTKLIHGGVRYLAQGHFGLVREASVERAHLLKNAPHLVRNQTFVIPVYKSWDAFQYTVGLKIYDWISGRLSLGSASFISRKKVLESIPNINGENLIGGIVYHDGQFDDARLAVNLAQTIIDEGGTAINYLKVTNLIKNKDNLVSGVELRDEEIAKKYKLKAMAVVNATGVFADDILEMDNANADKTIQVSQGTHLVINKEFYPSNNALMIPRTPDGRVLFLIPWHEKVVVGTTDSPVPEASLEPIPLEEEIKFILDTASSYLNKKPGRKDIQSVFAGLRPLAAQKDQTAQTKEISRNYKIIVSPSSLFTIVGGKWTTYRRMGEDMIDKIESHFKWNKTKSITNKLKVHGWEENNNVDDPLAVYGNEANAIKSIMESGPGEWISKSLNIHAAQVKWAVAHEMARSVEDVLARRTRALLLDAKESLRIAPLVATLMANLMKKDQQWIDQQLKDYSSLAKNYILL